MEAQDYLDRLFDVAVNGKRHKHYQKKQAISNWLMQMNTGKYQNDIIVSYRQKETKEQKEQRIRVYNSRTPQVCNKARSLFNEVHRTDDYTEVLKYEEDDSNEDTKKALLDKTQDFYGNLSVREYLDKKQTKQSFYDPNSWLVVEWKNKGIDQPLKFYPFLVNSSDVLDFLYDYGDLQCLIVRVEVDMMNGDKKEKGYKYTLYGKGVSIEMYYSGDKRQYVDKPDNTQVFVKEGKRAEYKTFDNTLDEVQAFPFGYIECPESDGFIWLSPLHYSKTNFSRLINRTSTLDISIACHGFLQKFVYANPCNHKQETEFGITECVDGYIGDHKCPACKGSGMQIHTSDQDIVYLPLPESPDVRIEPLSSLVYYANIDHQTVEHQRTEVQDAMSDCLATIFNEDVFERSMVTTTATESLLNWRSVYNTLAPYADHDAQMYEFAVRIIAKASGIYNGFVHHFNYPSDFHMESIQELVTLASSVPEGKLAPEVLTNINYQIVKKQTSDDPLYLENYKAKEKFRPFTDIPSSQLFVVLNSLPDDHPKKVLYYNFKDIFLDIENEYENFGVIPYDEQKKIVAAKIQEYSQSIVVEKEQMIDG